MNQVPYHIMLEQLLEEIEKKQFGRSDTDNCRTVGDNTSIGELVSTSDHTSMVENVNTGDHRCIGDLMSTNAHASMIEHASMSDKREAGTPSLLLHSCCAPCSSYVYVLLSPYFRITGYYYNPNIHPQAEYEKRYLELQRLASLLNEAKNRTSIIDTQGNERESSCAVQNEKRFPIYIEQGSYDDELFFHETRGHESEPEGARRCEICFAIRLEAAAKRAAELGCMYVGTTLSVSPHKNARLINEIGERAASKYGVSWLYADFKKRNGYQLSVEYSKAFGLYRQNYCGCKITNTKR
ncbi:MAG: epoxyqueuosine reductase QueH [Clostridium sp.]|jgi:predicted adenine nucleotide alpha hydrolase (AANH) superfamily ATPase|nr:epoxyqueuosine reductase QueH [Clostridium sp.]